MTDEHHHHLARDVSLATGVGWAGMIAAQSVLTQHPPVDPNRGPTFPVEPTYKTWERTGDPQRDYYGILLTERDNQDLYDQWQTTVAAERTRLAWNGAHVWNDRFWRASRVTFLSVILVVLIALAVLQAVAGGN